MYRLDFFQISPFFACFFRFLYLALFLRLPYRGVEATLMHEFRVLRRHAEVLRQPSCMSSKSCGCYAEMLRCWVPQFYNQCRCICGTCRFVICFCLHRLVYIREMISLCCVWFLLRSMGWKEPSIVDLGLVLSVAQELVGWLRQILKWFFLTWSCVIHFDNNNFNNNCSNNNIPKGNIKFYIIFNKISSSNNNILNDNIEL